MVMSCCPCSRRAASHRVCGAFSGVAASVFASTGSPRSVLDHMRSVSDMGARFLACSMALHERALALVGLIPECTGGAGATAFVVRALDPEWSTLVF